MVVGGGCFSFDVGCWWWWLLFFQCWLLLVVVGGVVVGFVVGVAVAIDVDN